jgi:SAM-dependent methyltransferase
MIREGSVDMVYSQAVLEHVDDLDRTYEALSRWLKPKGFLSCQIDFRCHETAKEWNGHWTYSDLVWKLIRGRRPYLLNREPLSTHLQFLKQHGFEIVCEQRVKKPSRIERHQFASRFRNLPEEDLTTSGVFIQAVQKN